MREIPKVFCSHRGVDKPRVLEVARKLAEAGIDPWVDAWEILPGDDFIAKINPGLEECDVGLVFFSKATEAGKWQMAEISALTRQAIQEGKRLIPVLLEPDVPIPPLLRPRSYVGIEQVDQLIEAIFGRTGKPSVAALRPAPRQRSFCVQWRRLGEFEVEVSAQCDEVEIAPPRSVKLGADFRFSYADFVSARVPGSRLEGASGAVAERERQLRSLGHALGRVVFPDGLHDSLAALLAEAAQCGDEIELVF